MQHSRLTTAVTLLVLCALMAFGMIVGARTLLSPIPHHDSAGKTAACTPAEVKPGKKISATEVTVSVFNASGRSGLASQTLAELGRRGFGIGDTGNAPASAKVRAVQVWTTKKDDASARLVALQFGPHTVVRIGKDLGLGVDVVVGQGFRGLVKAPTSVRATAAAAVCEPTTS